MIGYVCHATDGTGSYYIFVNADSKTRTLTLSMDLTAGRILADQDEAGIEEVSKKSGFELTAESITIDALTAVIIHMADRRSK
ncbi:hypothetical protein D3C76_1608630 [compost metagenome]